MADTRLRELERRFNDSRALPDHVAWLQQRVRVGDLSRRQLRVLSYVGCPAARELSPSLDVSDL